MTTREEYYQQIQNLADQQVRLQDEINKIDQAALLAKQAKLVDSDLVIPTTFITFCLPETEEEEQVRDEYGSGYAPVYAGYLSKEAGKLAELTIDFQLLFDVNDYGNDGSSAHLVGIQMANLRGLQNDDYRKLVGELLKVYVRGEHKWCHVYGENNLNELLDALTHFQANENNKYND